MKRTLILASLLTLAHASSMAVENYFTVLGILPTATPAQLDAAYESKRLGLIPDPLTVSEEDVADELALLDKAYETLKSPADRRYYTYTLLINGAEGRAPNLFGQTPRIARLLAQSFFDATRIVGGKIALIDTNKSVEKAYERQYKALATFRKGQELEERRAELERAKNLLTQPWRMLELAPDYLKDELQPYLEGNA